MKIKINTILFLGLILFTGCAKKTSLPYDHNQEALDHSTLFDHPDEISMYIEGNPDAEKIKKCALANTIEKSCLVLDSPLLGINQTEVTIDAILAKTLVSRKSYGDTFKSILKMIPPESLIMFGAVNAVVIADRITPSFYTFTSGAIYLSASYFWKTPEEKIASHKIVDYRSDFGNSLSYEVSNEYVKDKKDIWYSKSRSFRTNEEIAPALISLIFHELAHANDFFQKSFYNSSDLNMNKTFYTITDERWGKLETLSQNVKVKLKSEILLRVGKILYQGEEATIEDKNLKAALLSDEFNNDGASDMYAYSSENEDVAMLVERAMFFHYFKYNSYTYFFKFPGPDFKIPRDYTYEIGGAVKNKITDAKVKERAQDVLEKMFDATYAQSVINSLDKSSPTFYGEDTKFKSIEY